MVVLVPRDWIALLKRMAYDALLRWKAAAKRKVLLVDGARQIGKTFLIEEFARNEYASYIKIDFLNDARAVELLGKAQDARQVVEMVSLISGKPLGDRKTLLFFDEVQKAQNIVTISKYLLEDGRFDVVMSGSMLGVELTEVKSFPVGYMTILHMYPLTFEEFCWAQNVPQTVLDSAGIGNGGPGAISDEVHGKLIDLFRLYLVIGGMPEAVQTYLDSSHDLSAVREVLNDLVRLYREDIAKYANGRSLQVKAIYDEIPQQLAKENKRFQLNSLRKQARYERFANDFAWLVGAKTALKAVNVTEPKFMLARTEEPSRFKLYAHDCGMLMSCYPTEVAADVLAGAKSVNFGAVYENFVAQELAAAGVKLRYYHNNRRGEVDFVVETNEAQVLPIEMKSGKDYKIHSALNNLLSADEFGISEAVVLSEFAAREEKKCGKVVSYLPLYSASSLTKRLNADVGAFERPSEARTSLRVDPPTW